MRVRSSVFRFTAVVVVVVVFVLFGQVMMCCKA